MSYSLIFEIRGLPKTGNELLRGHWKTRTGVARTWKRRIWASCWHLKPDSPLIKAKLTLTRFSSRECDFDNLVSSFKSCIDGLVEAGILANDKRENIDQPSYLWVKAKPKQGKIHIRVEGD
jgi:hypothetical protein